MLVQVWALKETTQTSLISFSDRTQLEEAGDCTPCPGGQFCGQQGLSWPQGNCAGGYYCEQGADTPTPTDGVTGDVCPTGAYCPSGSNGSTLCPPGTYNPTTGLEFSIVVL